MLRLKGVNVLMYLDDWLIWAPSEEDCRVTVKVSLAVIKGKGFLINWKKSRLALAQTFQWIGLEWETKSASLSLPSENQNQRPRLGSPQL